MALSSLVSAVPELRRHALRPALAFAMALAGCTGDMGPSRSGDDGDGDEDTGFSDDTSADAPDPGDPGTLPSDPLEPDWKPVAACNPVLPQRVTRLSDRHLANAIRDLLGLSSAPALHTSSGSSEDFIPNKASSVNGAVASQLTELVESLADAATKPGKPLIACAGQENDCAGKFLDDFATRAFRRPLADDERSKLLAVYQSGRTNYGGHAGGIRLMIEAVLQAPSFLYMTELGTATGEARFRLTPYELAAKISFFLRDGLPDETLWQAARSGGLDSETGVRAEVDRLLETPEVKRNVELMFERLFRLEHVHHVTKATTVKEFSPALANSMHEETRRFIADVLWNRDARLDELLTSRETFADRAVAGIYGIAAAGDGFAPVTVPSDQRAGILTQPSVMTIEALPDESSVVHRGVFLVREMLCFHPPPPAATDLATAEELKKETFTERERAEKRAMVARCSGCHAFFDPYGVNFEHYDTLGRYRTEIQTSKGPLPVNASWEAALFDVRGSIDDAVTLAERLAESKAVGECMTRQFASYAIGQRIYDEQACTIAEVARKFDESGGNFVDLVREIALWPGLRNRQEGDGQ